jgi:hypothetical protein
MQRNPLEHKLLFFVIILSQLNCPNFFGSNDFVFFQRDDPKVVGDSVCEFTSFLGQRPTKELQNCFCELVEYGVVTIVDDPSMRDAPETFYRV